MGEVAQATRGQLLRYAGFIIVGLIVGAVAVYGMGPAREVPGSTVTTTETITTTVTLTRTVTDTTAETAEGPETETKAEALEISPESKLRGVTKTFTLVVKNTGTTDASITRITIGGEDVKLSNPTEYPILVNAGDKVEISGAILGEPIIQLGSAPAAGNLEPFEIHVYTAAGNDYAVKIYGS